jgi:Na+/H+ antiporter NhaD/arsenite permease-like protein
VVRFSCAAFVAAIVLLRPCVALASEGGSHWEPPIWSPAFFAILLGGIALFPLLREHWWENNRNKALFAALVAVPVAFLVFVQHAEGLVHASLEYVQFLSLIGALYVVAGGIHVTGNLRATPAVNTVLLGIGYLLASLLGTTGASMVLLYPVLRTNSERSWKMHTVVFFILAVSNAGGLMTPLGDPPLFLGFLRGVPFFWYAQHLWWAWAACGTYLLALYFAVDCVFAARESEAAWIVDEARREALGVLGGLNVLLLAGIVAATCFAPTPYREACYVACAGASLLYASRDPAAKKARERNEFAWGPIAEVAILFAAIFVTMIPALALLQLHGGELGVQRPWQYFLATGGFSSVLDNAPTYLIFQELGMSTTGVDHPAAFAEKAPRLLAAVAVGSVFMGANTYIGNAPNFMVKAVAEKRGVRMPNFFAYAVVAIAVLAPIYAFLCIVL